MRHFLKETDLSPAETAQVFAAAAALKTEQEGLAAQGEAHLARLAEVGGQARLAAFCSAKGRVMASFVGIKRSHQEIWLVCALDLMAPTLTRLSMFVLRAKATLSDATADVAV